MSIGETSEPFFLNNSSFIGVYENTNVSACSSDTEEIEVEPELRPTNLKRTTSPTSQKTDIVDDSQSLLASTLTSDPLQQNKIISEQSEYKSEIPLTNANEIRERKRTAYSYNSSSLSEITKKEPSKSTNTPSKNIPLESANPSAGFSCNICFDTACNPVLTLCGHLFCWPCLHRWLSSQHKNPLCPVCKAGCGKDKVIPVYGRGSEENDPRLSEPVPDRPKGQRPKPQSTPSYGGWSRVFGRGFDSEGFGNAEASSFNFHAGFGFFPTLTFHYTSEAGAQFHTNAGSPQQGFLFRLFLMLVILVFIANLLG